jgi:hypothetical protein
MIQACPLKQLDEIKDEFLKYDIIGIDEGQFFSDVSDLSPQEKR